MSMNLQLDFDIADIDSANSLRLLDYKFRNRPAFHARAQLPPTPYVRPIGVRSAHERWWPRSQLRLSQGSFGSSAGELNSHLDPAENISSYRASPSPCTNSPHTSQNCNNDTSPDVTERRLLLPRAESIFLVVRRYRVGSNCGRARGSRLERNVASHLNL